MKDFELSIEQKKQEIIEDRLRKIRDAGHTGEINLWIKYLGKGKDTEKDFFSVEENYSGISKEIFYEYTDQMKELPLIRNKITDGKVIRANNMQETPEETKEIEDAIQDIERCIEDRHKEMKAIAKQLGIDEKEINSISEIDLEQKIVNKEKESLEEKEHEPNENEPQKISEEKMNKSRQIGLNEVDLNARVDGKGTRLKDVLKLDGYTKIMVVHSYKLAELTNADGEKGKNQIEKYSLIAQKADGTYETLPQLEPDRGENKQITEINEKDNVETSKVDNRFKVPGSDDSIVIDAKDPYNIPNVYLSRNTPDNDGQLAQRLQDKYDGTERTDVEVRAVFNANRGEYMTKEAVKEAEKHPEDCEKGVEEVDGDENTGHVHFDPQDTEQQNAINEIMEKGKVSREEATRLFATNLEARDNQKEGQDKIEKAKDMAIDEVNEQARGDIGRKRG